MFLTSIITPSYSVCLTKVNTGLGNCLFQISNTIIFSLKYNYTAIFPNLLLLCDKLMNLTGDNYKNTLYRNINIDGDINNFIIIKEDENMFENIEQNKNFNICIDGYLGNYKYFDSYRELLLDLFSIDSTSLNYIQTKYPSLFDKTETHISLHIRMNDLESVDCGFEFYKKAIEYMNSKFENIHYYLVSDNISYYLDLISKLDIKFTYVQNNPDYIDLWIQTLCDHNIICCSTFSWWGAYLNNNSDKIVLYPLSSIEKNVRVPTYYHHTFTGL
jgi:hypothetical protein